MIRLVGYALSDFLITIAVLGPFFAFFIALILLRAPRCPYYLLFTEPRDPDWFLDRAIGFRDPISQVVRSRLSGDT